MKIIATLGLVSLASLASAHTVFTTLFINGKHQGDGTCVRMPLDGDTATNPIKPINGSDMACGRDGDQAVQYTCPADKGATLTFEFRLWPGYQRPGVIDPGHLGPCAVYLKRMDSGFAGRTQGPGWFKIWEDGLNLTSTKWCVDTLIKNNGLLSVRLPAGLPTGYYLVRPEILALHYARHGDPQYFLGCAQIFVRSDVTTPLRVPINSTASIPGYVDSKTPGLTYDIYRYMLTPYPIPGPPVFHPPVVVNASRGEMGVQDEKTKVPADCLIKNANWCGRPIKPYSTEDDCWVAVKECYKRSATCRRSSPASGERNCEPWSAYCGQMNDACERGQFNGPPEFTGSEKFSAMPGPIPEPWNDIFEKR